MDMPIIKVRCQGHMCSKLLGIVDQQGRLITKSNRSGWPIETRIEKGEILCTNCNTLLQWTAKKSPHETNGRVENLEELHHG